MYIHHVLPLLHLSVEAYLVSEPVNASVPSAHVFASSFLSYFSFYKHLHTSMTMTTLSLSKRISSKSLYVLRNFLAPSMDQVLSWQDRWIDELILPHCCNHDTGIYLSFLWKHLVPLLFSFLTIILFLFHMLAPWNNRCKIYGKPRTRIWLSCVRRSKDSSKCSCRSISPMSWG